MVGQSTSRGQAWQEMWSTCKLNPGTEEEKIVIVCVLCLPMLGCKREGYWLLLSHHMFVGLPRWGESASLLVAFCHIVVWSAFKYPQMFLNIFKYPSICGGSHPYKNGTGKFGSILFEVVWDIRLCGLYWFPIVAWLAFKSHNLRSHHISTFCQAVLWRRYRQALPASTSVYWTLAGTLPRALVVPCGRIVLQLWQGSSTS